MTRLFSTSRRGVALVAVLWVGLLAALLLVGVRVSANVGLALSRAELETVQARWLARAGVDQAMAVLADDLGDSDSSLDFWYRDAVSFEGVELASGTYSVVAPPGDGDPATVPRYGVLDLAGLLSLDHAEEGQLEELPGVDAPLAASVADWRDEDASTRTGGAEGAYYAKLDHPYEAADRPFRTLLELRLVKGVDEERFRGGDLDLDGVEDPDEDAADLRNAPGLFALTTPFGYELNRDGAGRERVHLNEADETTLKERLNFGAALAQGVVKRRGEDEFESVFDLMDVQPEQGVDGSDDAEDAVQKVDLDWIERNLDLVTLSDEERLDARINVNTSPREVLLTLPELTDDIVDRLIRYRDSDAGPFDSVGELRDSGVLDDRRFRAVAEKVTVRSQVFRIDATGEAAGGVRRRVVAVVDRGTVPMRVLYWYEGR